MIWWILPALAGVTGLMMVFAGIARVAGMKLASGGARLFFGVGFLGLSGVIAFAGLNLQTYKQLTRETAVTRISFASTDASDSYTAKLTYPGGETAQYPLTGDEWEIGARVIRFQPMANMLGYDSVYKLDRLYGRYTDVARADETNGIALSNNPGLDVRELAKAQGRRFGLSADSYGSAVYNPMADKLVYDVKMTQTGLVVEAANAYTRAQLGQPVATDPDTP